MHYVNVAIVPDSSISLPEPLIKALPVHVVPFEIHHAGRIYRDGLDITASEFYQIQQSDTPLPTTSAPSPGAFLEAYKNASQNAGSILCITLSSQLSAAYSSALLAMNYFSDEFPDVKIRVIDSQAAGTAEGLLVLEIARIASNGAGFDQLLEYTESRIGSVYMAAYLETLYYIWRGGRIPRIALWMSKFFKIRPVLEFSEGHIGLVERPRSSRLATKKLVTRAKEKVGNNPVRVAIIHADASQQAIELQGNVNKALNPVELFISELAPVIGAHTGPGLVGCAIQIVHKS